ncbi:MAG: LPS export ABC transporter permease LptG [Burkholderiales bacterium]|nr:LPS export ABC transporter permease LptG [Burkholderiales bacterium]
MRTVRRLLYRDIAGSVGFVAAAFLALFFFIDLVDKLDGVGKRGRTTFGAVLEALLELPGRAYELMPIAVLIGAIFSLARLAQNSEFTILRTGGLGPRRALVLLAWLGVAFALLTFAIGDAAVPAAERYAVRVRAGAAGVLEPARTGAWLRDRRVEDGREIAVSVNVGAAEVDGSLRELRIFEFDETGHLRRRIAAARARVGDGVWQLEDAQTLHWPDAADGGRAQAALKREAQLAWPTGLGAGVVAAALLPDETMTTLALWRYASHLEQQQQTAQRQQLMFWRRAFYPLSCIVMMALALPFAYLHARAGGVSLKVFGGIMLGIGFVLLNNISGHLGLLAELEPWLVSAAPGLLFLLLSLGAYAWLVRYR